MTYTLPAIGAPAPRPPLPKVAVEEHFNVLAAAPASAQQIDLSKLVASMGYDRTWMSLVDARLVEFEERVKAMDAAGVDVAVLSHTVPGAQGITDASLAAAAARDINDFLANAIARHPTRLAGLASVALHDPSVGARELERAVTQLGFKGAMINGYTNVADARGGEYLDAPRLLPFWEAVAHLRVPIYLHPRPALDQRVHDGHAQLIGATWGFAPETASHALRIVQSGLFDRFPTITMVLGHLGETLPYFAWRIQHCFEFNPVDKRLERRLQDYLCDNFFVSTSGFFNDQALIGAVLTIGADRILFAVDYPYEPMDPATAWIERAPISELDRRKIAHLNARALFSLPRR
ncbi:MAG TPA: amidohydrolase family protein [Vicinamibacterales bacterium]|nr:amidohydrolase family protein [Vicinamibacterales bacterium]